MRSFNFLQEEELNMTLQVALVGKDGFVIASDMKAVAESLIRRATEMRQILISEKGDLVCAFSGHHLLSKAANRLLKSASEPGTNISLCLEAKAEQAFDDYERNIQVTIHGDLIVAIPGTPPQMWNVSFLNGQASSQPVSDRVIRGDRINPAVFFAERYHAVEQSVEELKVLAAHTVIEGGLLDPTYVGGLDVLVSTNGEKPRFLEEHELQLLRSRSADIHNALTTAIFPDISKQQ